MKYIQTASGIFASYASSLYNFEFIEAKLGAGMENELMEDYNNALVELNMYVCAHETTTFCLQVFFKCNSPRKKIKPNLA